MAASLLFFAVPGEVSILLAAKASLPLHAVIFDPVSELLAKPEAVMDNVLSCLFRAEPDPEGGMAPQRDVFLLHLGNILDTVAEMREVVLLADLLDAVVFRVDLDLFSWCEMDDNPVAWADDLDVVSQLLHPFRVPVSGLFSSVCSESDKISCLRIAYS